MDKNVEESESDCFVIADDEFETYFQLDKSQVQRNEFQTLPLSPRANSVNVPDQLN